MTNNALSTIREERSPRPVVTQVEFGVRCGQSGVKSQSRRASGSIFLPGTRSLVRYKMPRLALFVLVCAERPVLGVRVSALDLGLFGKARALMKTRCCSSNAISLPL